MSSALHSHTIPQWTVADRLDKAMRHAGLTVHEMADYFDVHRNTVSGWINGRIKPDTRTLRLWAMHTNVPYEWLRDGTEPDTPCPPGCGGQVTDKKRKPPSRQPVGWAIRWIITDQIAEPGLQVAA